MTGLLRLKARDEEDLRVLSAVLQDAIVPICDMGYQPAERRFVMIANRFRWEEADREPPAPRAANGDGPTPDVEAPYERINCAVRFEGVDHVCCRSLNLKDRTQMLSVLAVEPAGQGTVLLHFAGGACVKLTVSALDCRLEDLGEAWPTVLRPCHDAADTLTVPPAAGR